LFSVFSFLCSTHKTIHPIAPTSNQHNGSNSVSPGFILPNEGSHEPLATFAVTVDAVEKATGLNFFSRVPKEEQERLERTISVKAWKGL
jgi:DNA/RNA endonuclease G (NUC1)